MCFEGITTASGFDSKPLSTSGLGAGFEGADIVDDNSNVVVQKEDERHGGHCRGALYITVMGDVVSEVDHPARNWSTGKPGMARQCIPGNTVTKLCKRRKIIGSCLFGREQRASCSEARWGGDRSGHFMMPATSAPPPW